MYSTVPLIVVTLGFCISYAQSTLLSVDPWDLELVPEDESLNFKAVVLSRHRRNEKFRVCGKKLTEMVVKSCGGCVKQFTSGFEEADLSLERRKRSVFGGHRHKREKRGLADECCQSQCTKEDLKKYCC